jgi:hypothetical protein
MTTTAPFTFDDDEWDTDEPVNTDPIVPAPPSVLRFSRMENNSKLKNLRPHLWERGYFGQHLIYNNPAGYSCPNARECHAWSHPVTGKIGKGKHQIYRCYAASLEARSTPLRKMLHANMRMLKEAGTEYEMFMLIKRSLQMAGAWDNGSVVRVHSHGDFFSEEYLRAWTSIAKCTPNNHYYAYTKAVRWAQQASLKLLVPSNCRFTMSRGGTEDHLIPFGGVKEAIVVGSEEEAADLGLEIDHDDSHACFGDRSFALLIHGAGNAKLKGTRIQPQIALEVVA